MSIHPFTQSPALPLSFAHSVTHTRAHSLLSKGYSLEDIAAATMEADAISRDRSNSANAKNWDKVNEVSERFGRLFNKALSKKKPQPEMATMAGKAA
jgi:hypothetical protein